MYVTQGYEYMLNQVDTWLLFILGKGISPMEFTTQKRNRINKNIKQDLSYRRVLYLVYLG